MYCTDNKGMEGDVLVVDEASRFPKETMEEALAPLLRRPRTAMFLLSTETGVDNHFSQWMNSKDPEMKRLAYRIQKSFMCDDCVRSGADSASCTHRLHMLPAHVTGNNKLVKLFMGGSSALFAREVLGKVLSEDQSIFHRTWLDAFKDRPVLPLTNIDPAHVTLYTAIDPNGGSATNASHTAIVTLLPLRTATGLMTVIVGLASFNVQNEQHMATLLSDYFKAFQRHPLLSVVPHVVTCENNYGGVFVASSVINRARLQVGNHCMREFRTRPDQVGFRTTHATKSLAVTNMLYDMEHNLICFSTPMVTPSGLGHEEATAQMQEEFRGQCSRLRKVIERKLITYTGKQPGKPDDMLSAYWIAHYTAQHLIVEELLRQSSRGSRAGGGPSAALYAQAVAERERREEVELAQRFLGGW